MIADHFTLLGVLGGRTETTCTHHRFPLTAYVSGSVIVLWDFVKDQKNFIPTHVTCWAGLAFDQDCRHVLGLYLAQDDNDGGKLHVCVFRTVDGELIFETDISEGRSVDDVFVIRGLTDKRLLCIGKSAIGGFAQVLQWDAARLKLCIVSQGSLGNTSGIRSARFLEESDRFVTTESHCIKNWYCQPSAILLTSRINTRQSTNAIQISPVTQLMYLITSKGKAVCVSENGTVLSTFHLAGTVFTTLLLTDQMIYFGSRCGRLLCYSASSLELIRTIECPASQTLSATNVHQMEVPRKGPSVREILSAAGGEFLLVQYSDCSLSVLHASSGQFIAHRISHTGPLSSLALPSLSTGPLSTGAAQKVPPPLLSAALSDRCVISWPPVARAQQATRGFQGGSAPFRTCLPVFLPTRDQEERIIEPDPPDIDGQPVAPLAGQVKVPGAFGVRRNPETLVIESFAPLEDGIAPGVPPQRIRCLSFVPGRERPTSFPSIAKGEHTLQGACLSTQVAVASPRGKRGGGRSALLERERGLVPSVEAPQIDARDGGTAVVGCQDGSIYSLVMKVSAVQIRNKNKMGGERIGERTPAAYEWETVRVRPPPSEAVPPKEPVANPEKRPRQDPPCMGQPDEGLGLPPLRDPRSPQARAVLGGSAGARLSFAKGDPHPRGVGYACVSLSFSPDGFLLLAAYENGLVDLLNFPELDRALVVEAPFKTPPRRCSLQHPQSTFDSEEDVFASKEGGGDFRARHFVSVAPPAEGPQAEEAPAERRKALFLQGRPQRARDGDTAPCTGTRMGGLRGGGGELFILSQQGVGEVVLYETFPIGSKRAKHVAAEYRVPDMENTTNGMLSLEIADFCPHPSSLYLIAVCNLSPFFVLPHGAASLAEAAESDATPLRWAGMQTLVFELATGTLLCHAACDPSPSGSRLACSALFLNCDPSGTFFFVGAQVIRRGEGGNEVENGGEEAGKAQHVPPIGRPTSEAAGAMAGSAGRLSAENLLNAIESLRREGYAKRETGGGGAFPALLGLGGGGAPQGVGAHWQWADSIPGRFSGNEDRLKGRQGQPINEMNIIKRAEDGLIGGPYPTLLTAISFETGLPAYSLTVDLAPSPPPCPSECLRFLPDDLSTVFSGHADGSLSFWRLPARMLGLIGKTFQYASVDREMFPSCLYELSALEQADAPLPGQFAERLLSLQALTEFWGQTALRAPAWTQWAHKFRIAPPADEEVRSPLCNPSPPNLIRRPDSIGKGSGGREDPLAEARQAFIPPSTGRLAAVSGPLAGANPPRFSVAAGAGTPTTWVSAHAAVKARPPHRTSSVPFAGAVRDPVEADVMEDEEGNSRLVAYAPELVRRYGDRRVDMAAADPIPGCPFDCPQGAERGVRLSSTSLLPSTVIPAERGFLQQKEGRVGLAPRTVRVGGKSPEALGTAALSPRLQLPINANSRPGAAPGFAVKEGLGGMQFEVVERVFGDLDSFERQHIPSDGSDDDPYFEDGV